MPQISGDTYKPLSAAQKTEAANYMQNLIRQGGLTDKQIIAKAGHRIPNVDQSDELALYTIIRQAHRTVDATEAFTRSPSTVPAPSLIPSTPRQPGERGQLVYDVVIEVRDPVTGEIYTTREEIVTSTPMSLDGIKDYVLDHAADYQRSRGGSLPARWQDLSQEFTIHLLDVGRGA